MLFRCLLVIVVLAVVFNHMKTGQLFKFRDIDGSSERLTESFPHIVGRRPVREYTIVRWTAGRESVRRSQNDNIRKGYVAA